MQLTKKQLEQLRLALKFRESPPTVLAYLRLSLRVYLYLLVVGGAGIAFFLWGGWPIVSAFLAGLVVATVARDVRLFRQLVRNWQLSCEVTDWERVEQLVAEHRAPAV